MIGTGEAGPVALVGSGEFLEVMVPLDAELLAGRPQRAVFLPTASAEEGADRVKYWMDLGTAHYAAMGVEPVALPVLDREDAERPRALQPRWPAPVSSTCPAETPGTSPTHLRAPPSGSR